jgi:hypothetical protein
MAASGRNGFVPPDQPGIFALKSFCLLHFVIALEHNSSARE